MVRTVLRAVGLSQVRHFQHYHRVLSRAVRSSLGASRLLSGVLVAHHPTIRQGMHLQGVGGW
jgi:hypothetical protein